MMKVGYLECGMAVGYQGAHPRHSSDHCGDLVNHYESCGGMSPGNAARRIIRAGALAMGELDPSREADLSLRLLAEAMCRLGDKSPGPVGP